MKLRKNQRVGPYVVLQVLPKGHGGFAQVLHARLASGVGEDVALKLARSAVGEREAGTTTFDAALQNEVELLRRLHHRGIVRIVPIPLSANRAIYMARDLSLPGHPWYFAMEFLAGGTLDELVQRHKRLAPGLAIEIAIQVAQALAYIHEQGMWHYDVKARNIMFRYPVRQGQPVEAVLGDFGVAQDERLKAAVEGGSIEYLSPERLGELDSGGTFRTDAPKKADVYALGVVLYYMVTGRMPFRGSHARITTAIRTEQPVSPLVLNKELADGPYRALATLIASMMAKDPAERPSAQEVAEHLEELAPAPREWQLRPAKTKAASKRQRVWLRWAGLGVALFLTGALVVRGLASRATDAAVSGPTVTPSSVGQGAIQIMGTGAVATVASPTLQRPTASPTAAGQKGASASRATATLVALPTSMPVPTAAPRTDVLRLVSPANDARIDALPLTLQWQARALADGERFAVTLRDEGGQTMALYATSNSLAVETWTLAQQGKIFWQVSLQTKGEGDAWTTLEQSAEGRFVVALAGGETASQSPAPAEAQEPTYSGEPKPAEPTQTATTTRATSTPRPMSVPTSAPEPTSEPSSEPTYAPWPPSAPEPTSAPTYAPEPTSAPWLIRVW
ncbi:MAG: protein kinase [Anaerolineales bacterium]